RKALGEDEARGAGISLLGSALALALHRQGWAIESEPGEPVRARKGGAVVEPFKVVGEIARGELSADAWRARCESLGLASVELGAVELVPSTAVADQSSSSGAP